jgi:23S rRNA (uracil1939-C5)-methyltransferase
VSLAAGARLELRIERLAAGGAGVAHCDGRAVLVPLSAPGDLAEVELTQVRGRYAHARLIRVVEPGPARRAPACPYFPRCGGCDWLHLDEATQSDARVDILENALRRIGGVDPLPPIERLRSPLALGYRTRARVACDRGRVGFRARGSHELVDVERCAVLDPPTQAALDALRRSPPRRRGEVELRGYANEVRVGAHRFRISRDSFFQANRALWERWLEVVLDACGSGDLAVELYAGVGFYTAGLAERFKRVIALERSRASYDARRNARAEVVHAPAEAWAPTRLEELAPDLVLLNPPRSGCHRSVSEAIAGAAPTRIVYVSCDPATLARDVARLREKFRVTRLISIDSLPQTHHVEVICCMQLVDTSDVSQLESCPAGGG